MTPAAYLIKQAVSQAFMQNLRHGLASSIKGMTTPQYSHAKEQERTARLLGLLTRARAKEFGLKHVRTKAKRLGGELGQSFLREPSSGGELGAVEYSLFVNSKAPGVLSSVRNLGPQYYLSYLQGYGPTKGAPLRLYRAMSEEVASAHGAAGIPYNVMLKPGRNMPDPKNYRVIKEPQGISYELKDPDVKHSLDAQKMWAHQTKPYPFSHYRDPYDIDYSPITDSIRKGLMSGDIDAGALAYRSSA